MFLFGFVISGGRFTLTQSFHHNHHHQGQWEGNNYATLVLQMIVFRGKICLFLNYIQMLISVLLKFVYCLGVLIKYEIKIYILRCC